MTRILPVLILISLIIIKACGGTNHWDGLSGAAFETHNEVYVSQSTGNDITGDGSSEKPFASIAKGMDDASTRGFSVVRVAQGSYAENINLIEGISLYGGYEPLSWTRNSALYVTEIKGGAGSAITADIAGITSATVVDGFSLQSTGAPLGSVRILNSSPTISNNTIGGSTYGVMGDDGSAVISGNTINAVTGIYTNMSSDTIRNNTINATNRGIQAVTAICLINGNTINSGNMGIECIFGGACTIEYNTVTASITGILSDQGFAVIRYNTITCTTGTPTFCIDINQGKPEVCGNLLIGGSSLTGDGIRIQDSNIKIYNNVIVGGPGTNNWRGILCLGVASPEIFNNTLEGITATNFCYGITINTATPLISNNIIHIGGAAVTQIGIREENAASDPIEFRNNDIFGCTTALYRDQDGGGDLTVIGDLNNSALTTQGVPASSVGNVSIVLTFGPEQQITVTFPAAVINGGLNGIDEGWGFDWGFNDLRQRINRPASTNPWSIGAYEY